MQSRQLEGLPVKEDRETQDFLRRSIEGALAGNVKRQREIAARVSQAQTETPLLYSVMEVADLTGMPHPPGMVYFVQNEGTFYYYNSVTPAFEPIINGVGTIADGSVANAKLANMAAATVKGRAVGAGTGVPTDLTATQLNSVVGSQWLRAEGGVSFHPSVTALDQGYGIIYYNDGSKYPLRIIMPDDASNHRYFIIGRYVSSTWTPAWEIDAQNGNMHVYGTSLFDKSVSVIENTSYPTIVLGKSSTRYGQLTWDDPNGESLFQTYSRTFPFAIDSSYMRVLVNGGNERLRVNSTGLGIGTPVPQGDFHILATSGSKMFTTKTAIDGTAQTLVPDGTGDATVGVKAIYIVTASGGSSNFGSGDFLNNTDTTIFTTGGGSVLKFRVNSNGSVDLRRSSGSETFTVVVDMIWR